MSQVLGPKHGLSIEAAQALAEKLKLNSDETKWFVQSVGALHSRNKTEKLSIPRRSISVEEVSDAIARLKHLDLIVEKDGKLKDVFKFLATPNDVPSASLKKFHQQLMKKAMEALYEQDVLNSEISSNIFSIRKEKLPEFKEKIRVFRRDIENETSQIKGKDAVYCLHAVL